MINSNTLLPQISIYSILRKHFLSSLTVAKHSCNTFPHDAAPIKLIIIIPHNDFRTAGACPNAIFGNPSSRN